MCSRLDMIGPRTEIFGPHKPFWPVTNLTPLTLDVPISKKKKEKRKIHRERQQTF